METLGISTAYNEVVAAQATLNKTIQENIDPGAELYQQIANRYNQAIEALFACKPQSLLDAKFLLTALVMIEFELNHVRKAVANIIDSGLLEAQAQ